MDTREELRQVENVVNELAESCLYYSRMSKEECVREMNKYLKINVKDKKISIEVLDRIKRDERTYGEAIFAIIEGTLRENEFIKVVQACFERYGYTLSVEYSNGYNRGRFSFTWAIENGIDYFISIEGVDGIKKYPIDLKCCASTTVNTFKTTDVERYIEKNAGIIICMGGRELELKLNNTMEFRELQKRCKELIEAIRDGREIEDSIIKIIHFYGPSGVKCLKDLPEYEHRWIGYKKGVALVETAGGRLQDTFDQFKQRKLLYAINIWKDEITDELFDLFRTKVEISK